MGLFDFLKRIIFGADDYGKPPADPSSPEPPRAGADPASLQNRDLQWSHQDAPPPNVDPDIHFQVDTNSVDQNPIVHSPDVAPPVLGSGSVQPASIRHPAQQPRAPQSTQLGLDTDKFTPLAAADALDATQQANWQTAYLDPLNVIPPEDLPRIQVIDRTMVSYGLITPEELAEIHDIGRQMDMYRNQAAVIYTAGQQAVQQARNERERVKAEKKREAAARKEAHQKAVAHRRATDIVFLGRGVSKGLADRRANLEKLDANHLPVLSTPAELAEAMELTIPRLRWLAYHNEAPTRIHYTLFHIRKRSGGVRQLAAPHREIARAQRWILDNVLAKLPSHDAAHGFVPGRSTLTNARPHVGAEIVINADLRDFFPSITLPRVDGLFRSCGFSPAVATILALLTTESPREQAQFAGTTYYPASGPRALPQGACTSPAISNLIARRLDHRLQCLANVIGANYTRYADDMTLSVKGEAAGKVGYLLARLRHIAKDEGFELHPDKTRVLRRNTRQSVTGIVVNDQPSVPRPLIRRLRAILHQAKTTGLEAQNRDGHPHFESWVRGMIAYIEMANPTQGGKLRQAYEGLDR